ncbi:MAG: UDP-N-acetylglucosamine 2-epimerase (hydrolyzing) [Oscillospiraceae bacterium]|nr:UDP-N-acetylglucosamine 2-epimerase (hydrolyzing) [Oscillospiraceae bacterium]
MKKVFVITSTRADYGLLRPVIRRLCDSDSFCTEIVATGTHIRAEFGNTIEEIRRDGFEPQHKIDILKFGNDDTAVAKTIAYTVEQFTDLFSTHKPDLVLVLGDRYEMFAVCTAASALGIPIAHISGGDVTVGAKDDFYRHCMTAMSSIHFPSCTESRDRLLRLGQQPDTVHLVGGLGDENIKNLPLMTQEELESSLEFSSLTPFFLITYHPETQKGTSPREDMENLFYALDKMEGYNLIFTKSNADAGGEIINSMVDSYCAKNSHRAKAFFSLGLKRYLSAMSIAAAVVGNSSSGVVETPTFRVPTVNIGDRQKGRYIAKNVICTRSDREDILKGIQTAVSADFRAVADTAKSPYDMDCVPSEEITKTITEFLASDSNKPKIFYDGE